jgi:hypothetical protein
MRWKWAGVTGITERRGRVKSASDANSGLALSIAKVTGAGRDSTGLTSTALQSPSSAVGSA